MASKKKTLLLIGVVGGILFLMRNQLMSLFSSSAHVAIPTPGATASPIANIATAAGSLVKLIGGGAAATTVVPTATDAFDGITTDSMSGTGTDSDEQLIMALGGD